MSYRDGPPDWFNEITNSNPATAPVNNNQNPPQANTQANAQDNSAPPDWFNEMTNSDPAYAPVNNNQNPPQDDPQDGNPYVQGGQDYSPESTGQTHDQASASTQQNQSSILLSDDEGNTIGAANIGGHSQYGDSLTDEQLDAINRASVSTDNITRLGTRMEFMEALRLTTGVNPELMSHKNLTNPELTNFLEKVHDGVLDLSHRDEIAPADARVAERFLTSLLTEVDGNPAATLNGALMSDNIIDDDDYDDPLFQDSISKFRDGLAGKEDALIASLFLSDMKKNQEYPYIADVDNAPPITNKFNLNALDPVPGENPHTIDAMRSYVEVKFAHDNFDQLSDAYKGEVTKDELGSHLDRLKGLGIFAAIRESNRHLHDTPIASELMTINGMPINDAAAVDSLMEMNDEARTGKNLFASSGAQAVSTMKHVVEGSRALDYQIQNADYLPEKARAPYSVPQMAAISSGLQKNFDIQGMSDHLAHIEDKSLSQEQWDLISSPSKIDKISANSPLNISTIRERLAFNIANYDQVGNFQDRLSDNKDLTGYPSQAEMRLALKGLNDVIGTPLNTAGITKLQKLITPSANSTDYLDFKQADADDVFLVVDSNMEKPNLSDSEFLELEAISASLENQGFERGESYDIKNQQRLDNITNTASANLLNAQLNSLSSPPSNNGVAANLGAGSDVASQKAAGSAYSATVTDISTSIIEGVLNNRKPSAITTMINNALLSPHIQAAANPLNLTAKGTSLQSSTNPAPVDVGTNVGTPESNPLSTSPTAVPQGALGTATPTATPAASNAANATPAASNAANATPAATPTATPAASNAEQAAAATQSGTQIPAVNSSGKNKPNDPNDPNDPNKNPNNGQGGRQQPSTQLNQPTQGGYAYGGGAVVAALGSVAAMALNSLTYKANLDPNSISHPLGNSDRKKDGGISPTSKHYMVQMQSSLIAFETTSKLLENNKINKNLSKRDERVLEKDLKKNLSVFSQSAILASEGINIGMPNMTSAARLGTADYFKNSSSTMTSLVKNASDKGLFSPNDREKDMLTNAVAQMSSTMSQLTKGAVTAVKSFFSGLTRS